MSLERENEDARDWPWEPAALPPPERRPSWLAPICEPDPETPDEAEAGAIGALALESDTFPVGTSVAAELLRSEGATSVLTDSHLIAVEPEYPDLRDENAALRTQLRSLAESIAEIRHEILKAAEPEVVRLACAIAERVTGHELTINPQLVSEWVEEAVAALPSASRLVVAVAADVGALITEATLRPLCPGGVSVEVDETLGSMQCEVRTSVSRVDASLEARLAAVVRGVGEAA